MESLILPDHAALPLEAPCMSTCLPETTGTEYRYRVLVYYAYPDASYSPLSKQNEVQVRFHTHKHIDLDRNVSLEGFREARIPAEEAKLKKWADKNMHRFYRKHKTWEFVCKLERLPTEITPPEHSFSLHPYLVLLKRPSETALQKQESGTLTDASGQEKGVGKMGTLSLVKEIDQEIKSESSGSKKEQGSPTAPAAVV